MLIATRYVGRFTPGEVLPDDLPRDTVEWLLQEGAAKEAASSSRKAEKPEAEPETEKTENAKKTPPKNKGGKKE